MLEFVVKAASTMVFSKVDLRMGYYQIPVFSADIPSPLLSAFFEY
jgi:hypothetical protein